MQAMYLLCLGSHFTMESLDSLQCCSVAEVIYPDLADLLAHLVVQILEDDPDVFVDLVALLDGLVDIPWLLGVGVDLLPRGLALEKLMSDVLGQISITVSSKIFFPVT